MVDELIEAFGGLTPMARAIGSPPNTVHHWKVKGRVPHWRHASIREAALREGVALPDSFPAAESVPA